MAGHGADPTPHQAATSAAGGTLSLTEYAKADTQQRDTDEHQQNRVSGHHIPHITDNGFDRAHIAKDAGYGSGSGSGLRRFLLS